MLVSGARKLLLQEGGKEGILILQGEDLHATYKLCSYFSIPWPQSGIFPSNNYLSQLHCGCKYYIVHCGLRSMCLLLTWHFEKRLWPTEESGGSQFERVLSFPSPRDTHRGLRGGKLDDLCVVSQENYKHYFTKCWDFLLLPKIRKEYSSSPPGVRP